jgi:16S rRNA (adenine1518-N6/adenine1519-N6)-dimethyltransferase
VHNFPNIKDIVAKYSLYSDKKLGQNFLYDLDLTNQIVKAAGDIRGKHILEIGPGAGSLTRQILQHDIASLTALELDSRCIKALSYLTTHYHSKLNLMHADALKFRISDHFNSQIYIIANLPYNISTQLFFHWVDDAQYISKMVLMFQKEVALRLIAQVGDNNYGKLSVIRELFFEASHYMDLAPELFYPAPKVESSVLVFTPRSEPKYKFEYTKLNQLLTWSFAQRRKMLKNNLLSKIPYIESILEQCSISKNARPEELSALNYVHIAQHILQINEELKL